LKPFVLPDIQPNVCPGGLRQRGKVALPSTVRKSVDKNSTSVQADGGYGKQAC